MDEYKSNSDKSKERETKEVIQPVVTAKISKEPPKKSFFSDFFTSDAKSIGTSIVKDVVEPGIKRGLHDALVGAADMLFYGKDHIDAYSRGNGPYYRRPGQMIDYSKRYQNTYFDDGSNPRYQQIAQTTFPSADNILYDDYGQAEEVLHAIFERLSRYGQISVGEVYSMSGISTNHDHTLFNFGWVDLNPQNTKICPTNGGYFIQFPKAVPFDN